MEEMFVGESSKRRVFSSAPIVTEGVSVKGGEKTMMKPRKVMVHLELLSDSSLILLRDKEEWQMVMFEEFGDTNTVHQVTVQVIKEKK